MFVKCFASTLVGIDAATIPVEVNIGNGIGMSLSGLPDSAVKESQERIRAAFENSGYRMSGKKVVVNLAPADLRKEGSAFDLPIAVGILAASGQVAGERLGEYVIVGELSLDGSLMPVKGALPIAIKARSEGFKGVILPLDNAREAAVVDGVEAIGTGSLRQVVEFLCGQTEIAPAKIDMRQLFETEGNLYDEDFADVKGQAHIKRALEIAVSGGHNILLIGAIGAGKTMLARRLPSIMPPMSLGEALETTKIHSVAGKLGAESGLMTRRPFCSPHHLTSQVALVGGGGHYPSPGEISLSHNGILFMDELPEFGRNLLEVLRQPMEDKVVTVSHAKYSVNYPANFMFVASMNPCPCGYFNHPTKECVCSKVAVFKYMNRISFPILDRIDMHIEVSPVSFDDMGSDRAEEPSSAIRQRVTAVRELQRRRLAGHEGVHTNAMMSGNMLREFAPLSEESRTMLGKAMERLSLSARAHDRIIKVARTIADMERSPRIELRHIAEAIQYRSLDRDNWGR
ncbi:MAG: YifB family Mg chelatase-like AAA ATPase [Rikenellaceae bacterium]|jgi:magnesium chelatase family protein|nr:YifB family Mg chelatase-like AAA ATPase [Rikenellaceae bacterium]